jgi:hypothetical protein
MRGLLCIVLVTQRPLVVRLLLLDFAQFYCIGSSLLAVVSLDDLVDVVAT